MAILFKVNHPSPWAPNHDDTYWTPTDNISWNAGGWWDAAGGDGRLDAIGGWQTGFRPTKIRITAIGDNISGNIYDANNDDICAFSTDGAEYDITFGSYDISHMWFYSFLKDADITNIEFYTG
jgi:hypothetical protein